MHPPALLAKVRRMENVAVLIHALPFFTFGLVAEALILLFVCGASYGGREALCTLGVAILGKGFHLFTVPMTSQELLWFYEWRWQTLSLISVWHWIALFIAVDFVYYWVHRFSHRVRWPWASHLVHHSSEHFRLSGAYRLGWTAGITGGWLMLVPFVCLGIDPRAVGMVFGLNLLYQFWLHTELIGNLGPFEKIFNTPSQHR